VRALLLSLACSLLASGLAHAQAPAVPAPAAQPAAPVSTAEAPAATTAAVSSDQEARASFAAGKAAYDNGDFAAALVQFERAYDLSHRSLLLYNLGLAHDRLKHEERALESYEAYLAANPQDERAPDARARVKELRESLAARNATAGTAESSIARDNSPDPRRRKRRLWYGIGFGVLAIGAGITAALVASRDEESGPRQPNSGVHIEALSW
jgi:tetratricopeptide (TPR) repeat protein